MGVMLQSSRATMRLFKHSLLLVVFIFIYLRLRDAFSSFRLAELCGHWALLVGSLAVFEVYLLSGAVLWHVLTRRAGVAIAVGHAAAIWFVSIMGKYVPGKALLWSIRYVYYRRESPAFSALGIFRCFLVEYLSGIAAGVGFILLAVALVDELSFSPQLRLAAVVLLGLLLLPLLLNHGVLRVPFGKVVARFGARHNGRFEVPIGGLYETLIWSLVNWNILGFAVFLMAKALRPELAAGDFLYISASYAFAGIVGFLAVFAPSGIGVREVILIEAMAKLIPLEEAAVLAALTRLISTLGEVLVAGASWLFLPGVRVTRDEMASAEEISQNATISRV